MSVTLILGGARSGKSRRAEALAAGFRGPITYVATAPRLDDDAEWEARIARHRERRPESWRTLEVPLELAETLRANDGPGHLVIVDCLTLWLSNQLVRENDLEAAVRALAAALEVHSGELILVSNEVGSGVHPPTELGRVFRDEQGFLNQRVAALADTVELMVAGLPMTLKP